ncbi:MAG: hypothetical protein EXR75_06675 [Myxococcales bacterium]|nr:hypothetical protein [Myxococcales bacterium]
MRFRIFGVPTEVQHGFWLMAVLLGFPLLQSPFKPAILVWVAAVFISVMVHELGHALAIVRHRLSPEITLYTMGGLTAWMGGGNLSRASRMFISFAGPLAGFTLSGLLWGATKLFPELVSVSSATTQADLFRVLSIDILIDINFYWGIINLVPVLPFDGGHILEHALGPRRARTTAMISLAAGVAVAAYSLATDRIWMGFIFAMSAMQSFQRLQAAAQERKTPGRAPSEPPLARELTQQLERGTEALADDRLDEARTIAELVLSENPPRAGRLAALHLLAWAHLLANRLDLAAGIVGKLHAEGVEPDVALAGAVLLARGERDKARSLFEAARARGDDRKEVAGPLIQILIAQGEIARAAAIAVDIFDVLSDADARQMAELALVPAAYGWSARLSEALFERSTDPEDAVLAARARSLDGDVAKAMGMLQRAANAGFTDKQRIISDAAFAGVLGTGDARAELDTLFHAAPK